MKRLFPSVLIVVLLGVVSYLMADATFDNLISSGKYKEALLYADDKMPPVSRNAAIWAKIAVANENSGLVEKALASYMVSWRMNPNNYDALFGAARIYNILKQYDNAINMASKALKQKFTGEASWEYARACIALKKPAEAKKALIKVMETDPSNVVANRELGIIYYNDKEYGKAIDLLKKAYAEKADAKVAYQIGKSYFETNNADKAIEYLKKTVTNNPKMYEAGLDLARAYYDKSMSGKAANEYKRISGKITFTAEDYFKHAMSLGKTGDATKAIAIYRVAITKYGSSKSVQAITARQKVGRADFAAKKYASTVTQFNFIKASDPKATIVKDLYFVLADANVGLKKISNAIKCFEVAISLDSKNFEAYARLADLYTRVKNHTKAKATYEKMMSLAPNDPKVYMVLGGYNLKAKNYAKAIDLFVKGSQLKKSSEAFEGIAICAAELKQWDKARDAAESAVSMDGSKLVARKVLTSALMRNKSYDEALSHLEKLVKAEPSSKVYWGQLADCYSAANMTDKLASADAKVIQLDSKNINARLRHAKYSLKKGDKENAMKLYLQLSVLTPKNESVWLNLYTLAKGKKQITKAITYLKKYVAINTKDAERQRDLGDMLYTQKKLDGSLAAYRAAIAIDPSIKGFYKRYAEIVIAKGQQNEVIKALSGVIKSGEADFGTYTTLGMIHAKKKSYDKAKEMYSKALTIDPQNTDALCALGDVQACIGDISAAVITYEQAVMMNPKAIDEYKALGKLYARQKKTKQSMDAYSKYLDKKPNDQVIAKKVGDYLFANKNYKGAAKYLAIVTGKTAQGFKHQTDLATAYFNAERYNDAITSITALIKRNPKPNTKKRLLRMKAESFEKTKQVDQALLAYDAYMKISGVRDKDIAFKRAYLREKSNVVLAKKIYVANIKIYPNDSRNYLRLGLIYSTEKANLKQAGTMLEKAAAKAGNNPKIWKKIAEVYGQLGNDGKELAAYQKYLQADPQNIEANIRIGAILMEKGKTSDGMIYLETANTLSPNNIRIMAPLATGYLKTDRVNEALVILKKAKKIKPDDVDIRRRLYQTYMKMGDKKAAANEIKELLDKDRSEELLFVYAKILFGEGDTKAALNSLEDILAVNPENIEALMLKALVHRSKKRYDEAIEIYKEITFIDANFALALYQRAETYVEQGKLPWAERFYDRAIRSDTKLGLAYLGIAKLKKMRKDMVGYKANLEKALMASPKNKEIRKEAKIAGIR